MQDKITRCVDAASENCPCYLAETGDCLICSRLAGKDECDCDWTGVCIYNEFILNGKRLAQQRTEKECRVMEKMEIMPGFVLMKISVDRGFAIKCLTPGTFIFVRKAGTEKYYETPMSLLEADYSEGSVTIGIRVQSVKTKSLISADDGVIVRGPYRNGIMGMKRRIARRKILIIAGGAGVIPAIFAANLVSLNNETDLLLSDGMLEKTLVKQYLNESSRTRPAEIIFRKNDSSADSAKTAELMRSRAYECVVILGNDIFVKNMREMAEEILPEAFFAFSNNHVTCCGEGICGACGNINKEGQLIHTCKCADPKIAE